MRVCNRTMTKALEGGVALEVRYAAGSEALAQAGLGMMERVERLMAEDLLLKVGRGARVFIVELEAYPPSFSIHDETDPSVVSVHAVMARDRPEVDKVRLLEAAIYSDLSHEWGECVLRDIHGERSPGSRARWISDGFASYVQHSSVRKLMPALFIQERTERLPLLNLDSMDLDTLIRWKFQRHVPPREPMSEFMQKYGAALGVFLRIEQQGGPAKVMAFLDRMAGKGRLGMDEVNAALIATVGRDLPALARMSAEEKDAAHEEAVAALGAADVRTQQFALAVIERFPDRYAGHESALSGLVTSAEAMEGIPARAAAIAMDQAPDATAGSLFERLMAAGPPDEVLLPVVLRLSRDAPACALAPLIRLAGSAVPDISGPALARLQGLAGRKMAIGEAVSWAEHGPYGACGTAR
jgi:hypothetical protein